MIFNNHQVFVLILTVSGYLTHLTDARKCYICGPNANVPLKIHNDKSSLLPSSWSYSSNTTENEFQKSNQRQQGSMIESCDNFQITNDNHNPKFIIDCPLNFQGCLTFINGTTITRTCEEADVNDCKIVNNIKYCICDYDLCNLNDIEFDQRSINSSMHSNNNQQKQVNRQQKHQQKDTISVSDIKLYHLLYNKMKPSVLLTNNNSSVSSSSPSSISNLKSIGNNTGYSNYTSTTPTSQISNSGNGTEQRKLINSTMTLGSSNVQSLTSQKNSNNNGLSANANNSNYPSYPRMNGTNLLMTYNNKDTVSKLSQENGNQKQQFCWICLIFVTLIIMERKF